MRNIIGNLFVRHNLEQNRYIDEQQRLAANKDMLLKGLNKWQKRQLLRIMDDKDFWLRQS